MRNAVAIALVMIGCQLAANAEDRDLPPKDPVNAAVFKVLSAGLPKDGQRAISARLELDYWYAWGHPNSAVRKSAQTGDGKAAEVILLSAPAFSRPGIDFSMAFLVVDDLVIDWASCWTSNRTERQELLLEDVDGDGVSDVAFRASDGSFGLRDERQHGLPGDKRKWLYAYALTGKGFRSLFPSTERELTIEVSCETADQPVVLQVKGLPETLSQRQMVECTLSLTNTSEKALAITPAEWFSIDIPKGGYVLTYASPEKRSILQAGETVSQDIRLVYCGKETEIAVRMKFEPNR